MAKKRSKDRKPKKQPVYVMVDVEASGGNMNNNCLLSWAACVVTPEDLSKRELKSRGLVYYDELKPLTLGYDFFSPNGPFFKGRGFVRAAMKVGCLGLRCLKQYRGDQRYNPKSKLFQPQLVLDELAKSGTKPKRAVKRFKKWLKQLAGKDKVVILGSDTSLFDLPWIKFYFDTFGRGRDILWHGGLNLHSILMGVKKSLRVSKDSVLKDDRAVAHCAEDDAIYLAKLTRIAIYGNCNTAEVYDEECV